MLKVVQCPECGRDLPFFDGPVSGQQIWCSHCDAQLEVIDAQTLELDWAYEPPLPQEDWGEVDAYLGTHWLDYVERNNDDELDSVGEGDGGCADASHSCGVVS